jgi:hypothetical protein
MSETTDILKIKLALERIVEGHIAVRELSTLSVAISMVKNVNLSHYTLTALIPVKEPPRYPLDRRFGGPQNRSGRYEKNSVA